MTKYKVIYFETTGIVEMVRLILVHAKQHFEDVRISLQDWPEFQKTIPFERLPVVEIDGEAYHQSLAVGRYLARQYKLAGEDEKENLEIDAIVDTINDMRVHFSACLWDPNPDEKVKKLQVLLNKIIPFYFPKFEAMVKNNGGYLWRNKLTWADFMFVGILPYLNLCSGADVLEGYTDLREYVEKISDLPNIREWMKTRPEKCCLRDLLRESKDNVINKSQ